MLPRQTKASCFPFALVRSAAQAAIKLFSLRPCSRSTALFSQQPGIYNDAFPYLRSVAENLSDLLVMFLSFWILHK